MCRDDNFKIGYKNLSFSNQAEKMASIERSVTFKSYNSERIDKYFIPFKFDGFINDRFIKQNEYSIPHLSFINYYCYHNRNLIKVLTSVIFLFIIFTFYKFNFNTSFIFISSLSIILWEYLSLVPFILIIFSSLITIIKFSDIFKSTSPISLLKKT